MSDDCVTIIMGPTEGDSTPSRAGLHRTPHRENTALVDSKLPPRQKSPPVTTDSRLPLRRESPPVTVGMNRGSERLPELSSRRPSIPAIARNSPSRGRSSVLEPLDDESGVDGMSIVEFDMHQDAEMRTVDPSTPEQPSSLYVAQGSPLWKPLSDVIDGHLELRTIYGHIEEGLHILEQVKAEKLTILNGRTALAVVKPNSANNGINNSVTIAAPWYVCNRSTRRHRRLLARASIQTGCLRLCDPSYTENLLLQAVTLTKLGECGSEASQTAQLLGELVVLMISDLIPYNIEMVLCSQKVPYTVDPEATVESLTVHQTITTLMERATRQAETTRNLRVRAKEVYQDLEPLHEALNVRSDAIQRSIFLVTTPTGSYKVSKQSVPPRGWPIELVITRLQTLIRDVFTTAYCPVEVVTAVKLGAPVFADTFIRRLPELFRRDVGTTNSLKENSRWVVITE